MKPWAIRYTVATIGGVEGTAAHPDKTFARLVSRGLDFLGYRFSAASLVGVAVQTVERCVERMNRLYEQGANAVRNRGLPSTLVTVSWERVGRL